MTRPSEFAERLRKVRERKGLRKADLAKKAGFQPSAISHFESGRRSPSFDNLRRLADALEVTTDFLLGRTEDVGAAGPLVQQLFRDVENLTSADLENLAKYADFLARKEDDEE